MARENAIFRWSSHPGAALAIATRLQKFPQSGDPNRSRPAECKRRMVPRLRSFPIAPYHTEPADSLDFRALLPRGPIVVIGCQLLGSPSLLRTPIPFDCRQADSLRRLPARKESLMLLTS